MRVLVTGATGFVGAHVVRTLVHQQHQVAILVRPAADCWRIAPLLDNVHRMEGDLRTLRASSAVGEMAAFAPEVVVHLAWEGVGGAQRNDRCQIDGNLISTLSFLDYCQQIGVHRWIGLGSQAEYGPSEQAIDESTRTHPTTLYGATKLAVCTLAERLCALEGSGFVWLRLFSTYGPMDDPTWLVPTVIRSLLRGECPSLTRGEQYWDYLYVQDVAEAIAAAVCTASLSGVYNLGSGRVQTIRSIVEHIRDLIDPALPLAFGTVPYRSDQVMHLQANITSFCAATGWQPHVPLAEGLDRTVDWYKRSGAIAAPA